MKTFRLLLENGNTGESYLYSIASSFFNNQIDYGFLIIFFVTGGKIGNQNGSWSGQ